MGSASNPIINLLFGRIDHVGLDPLQADNLQKGHPSFCCLAWQKGLDVTLGAQLSSVGYQWWSEKTYVAKGPAAVLMQVFHIELVHPRNVKRTDVLLTWRTQHSLVWNSRSDALFTYSQIKAWYCTHNPSFTPLSLYLVAISFVCFYILRSILVLFLLNFHTILF